MNLISMPKGSKFKITSSGISKILFEKVKGLFGRFGKDLGIDLGTANTLVSMAGKGIILREPSVVAINKDTGEVLAVGEEAKRMLGRTPANIVAIRPLKDGVIADYDQTEKMLHYFMRRATRKAGFFQTVVVGVPSGVTEVERLAVIEATKKSGANQAYVIEEPMAAAIGAGLPITEPIGSMIVDIGGGTTEVAMISLAGIVAAKSVRIAGDEIDDAIISYVRKNYNLYIGDRSAEQVKIEVGSAWKLDEELTVTVRGRDLISGLPKSAVLSSQEIRSAITEPINAIVEAVVMTLEISPPELASDVMNSGIVLAGGGALVRGLDKLIAQKTGTPVHIAEDPLSCVVLGTAKMVEALKENPMIRKMLERASKS